MSDTNPEPGTVAIERRSILTIGAAVAAGLAGCGGDGNDSDDQDDNGGDDGDGSDTGTEQPTGGGPGAASGGDCATVPSSYTREDIPAMLSDDPVATINVPSEGATINRGSATLRVEYAIGSVVVQSRRRSETTVEDELMPDLSEVTDEYDLPSGARAQREAVAQSDRIDVYIPAGSDVIYVSVAASGPDDCLEGTLPTIRDAMVDSIQPV